MGKNSLIWGVLALVAICFVGIITQNGKVNAISVGTTAPLILFGVFLLIKAIAGAINDSKADKNKTLNSFGVLAFVSWQFGLLVAVILAALLLITFVLGFFGTEVKGEDKKC